MYIKKIEQALTSDKVIDSLRNIVFEMRDNGESRDNVYTLFYDYYLKLEDEDNCNSEYLWDILDMISGWYLGQNID